MEQENRQLTKIAESLETIAASVTRDKQAEQYHAETHCQSCGRFVGTETRCPYCQAETQKRLSIRVFKVISVIISTLGLLMLLFYARNVQTPEVRISELGPLSNFAHVRIVGYAAQDAKPNKWGTLSFNVVQFVDEKGNVVTDKAKFKDSQKEEIRVSAYKKVAADIDEKSYPQKWDKIEVEGQIRVQQKEASMLINAPEHLRIVESHGPRKNGKLSKIQPKDLVALAPNEVTKEMLNKPAKITGLVKSFSMVKNDCAIISLESGESAEFPVFVTEYSKKNLKEPVSGETIEAVGIVKLYNEKLELEVSKSGYIKVMAK